MKNLHLGHENRARKYGLTAEERQGLVERHFEVMEQRQVEADLDLLRAVQLGEALKRLQIE